MADLYTHDVFLSHSSKDKAVVLLLAERFKAAGLKVWLDAWEIKPGDSIPAKIEEGLESSRVLVLCMSAHAFGSDWSRLESYTHRFRDPLNKERRFIPLRFDNAPIRGTLGQFRYISWLPRDRECEWPALLEACRHAAAPLKQPSPHDGLRAPDLRPPDSVTEQHRGDRLSAILALLKPLVQIDSRILNLGVHLRRLREEDPYGIVSAPARAGVSASRVQEVQDRIHAWVDPILKAVAEARENSSGISRHLSSLVDDPIAWETDLRTALRHLGEAACALPYTLGAETAEERVSTFAMMLTHKAHVSKTHARPLRRLSRTRQRPPGSW